jgi:hypothetical protein
VCVLLVFLVLFVASGNTPSHGHQGRWWCKKEPRSGHMLVMCCEGGRTMKFGDLSLMLRSSAARLRLRLQLTSACSNRQCTMPIPECRGLRLNTCPSCKIMRHAVRHAATVATPYRSPVAIRHGLPCCRSLLNRPLPQQVEVATVC